MDSINKIDTIDLLKRFWVYSSNYPNPKNILEEDMEDAITVFIKTQFPKIENPLTDIWNIVRINKD